MNGEAGSRTRILFVDDSKVMIKTASKILGTEFDVITAVDGDDAWEKLAQHPDIQVLFTDINMPGTDGYGLLKKVRTADDPGLSSMPVILVTGADDHEAARQKAMECGATDFIDKRSISAELLPRARAHANYQRITRQLQAQSTLDRLTGLTNETGFLERFEQDIFYARRHGQGLALMYVQIDGISTTFKPLGEDVLDYVVTHVAGLIRIRIRKEDTAGRIALGTFAISAPGGRLEGIEAVAASLQRAAAAKELSVDGQTFPIILRTAVISAESDIWASAYEALELAHETLEREYQAPVPKAPEPVAVPQAVTPAPAPVPVAMAKSEIKQKEPIREPTPVGRDREPAKYDRARATASNSAHTVQRWLGAMWSKGVSQGSRLARFLRNWWNNE